MLSQMPRYVRSQIEYIRPNLSHKPPEYHRKNNAPQNRDLIWFSIEYLNMNKSVTKCRILILYTYMVLLPNNKIYEIKD